MGQAGQIGWIICLSDHCSVMVISSTVKH